MGVPQRRVASGARRWQTRWVDGWCLVRLGWPRGQSGVDTRRPWLILLMFGKGSAWGRQASAYDGVTTNGAVEADVEGPPSWDRSVMI